MWIHLLMLSCLALATFADNSEEKSPATVRIHHERSTDSKLVASVDAFGKTHNLNLKQIEVPSIRAHEILETSNGTILTREVPVDNSVRYYKDDVAGALLYMADDVLEGMITNSISIRYENMEHVAAKIDGKSSELFCGTKDDNEELNKLTVPTEDVNVHDDGKYITFYPEILSIFDSEMYRKFGGSSTRLIAYARMFWKTVDKRYRTVKGANIYLKLSAVYYSKSSSLDGSFMDLGGLNVYETLTKFSKFMGKYRKAFVAHDISHLTTGRNLRQSSITSSVTGIAYVGRPCYVSNNRAYNTGLGEDDGYFRGMMTAAHEIAHNLGSPHDGKGSSLRCSWSLGYMMSYIRNSYKTFYFSSCSSKAMRDTFFKNHASCLRNIPSKVLLWPSGYPGLKVSLASQCKQRTGKSNAIARTNVPDSYHCYRLHCQYRRGSRLWYSTSFFPALEGSRCRSGGYCSQGKCSSNWTV